MKKLSNISKSVTIKDFKDAIKSAAKGHKSKTEVQKALSDPDGLALLLYTDFCNGTYVRHLSYRKSKRINNNGKMRELRQPSFKTRVYQHLIIRKLEPFYKTKDNQVGLNCKKKHGINSNTKKYSVIHNLKHVYYDRKDLQYAIFIDQRQCYQHITKKIMRRALRRIVDDVYFIDFTIECSFVENRFPVGTPTSPVLHHILLLGFDIFFKQICQEPVRYADDCIGFAYTKEDAQAAKWRIKNYWWYELGMRCKRFTVEVMPLTEPVDFCGYKIFRKQIEGSHQKGYCIPRERTFKKAAKCGPHNYPAYFGLLKSADSYKLLKQIEAKDMKMQALTETIRITRKMDAHNVDPKSILNMKFDIHDYEIRYKDEEPNWIKCLIGLHDAESGKQLALEFHGNYQYLYTYLLKCEEKFTREEMLPIEDVELEDASGLIFKGSTNMFKYIEDYAEYRQGSGSSD